jgi:hypothetical protein
MPAIRKIEGYFRQGLKLGRTRSAKILVQKLAVLKRQDLRSKERVSIYLENAIVCSKHVGYVCLLESLTLSVIDDSSRWSQ